MPRQFQYLNDVWRPGCSNSLKNAWRAGSADLIRIDGSGIGPVDEELIATDRVSLYETVGRAAEWELILGLSGLSG